MTLGNKIKQLRINKGLTQKDLSDQLHVTFQTVSKWENDENEPDVNTLRQLAKVFDVTVDYLLSEEENQPKKEVTEQVTKTIIIHQKELHVCARCGKDIPENELVTSNNTRKERRGRTYHTVITGHSYYHSRCLAELHDEQRKREEEARIAKAKRSKKLSFGWGIAGGIVAFITALLIFLCVPECQKALHPVVSVLLSILISYGIFAMIYCIITGSYIADVFGWVLDHTLKLPGLIFSWSVEGFAWLIAMKILFAILGFLFGIFIFVAAVVISATFAIVSFPFILIHNIHNDYADAL